ncbi:MAG: hypothetical protein J6L76_06100 [Clostridia bacterium]|nr:hypothetical protein [Clostridia bacterium]
MKAELSETNTKFDWKGTWQRLKKPLLIAFLALIVIGSYILYAENSGLFPGNLLNHPTVTNYLEEKYPDTKFNVSFKEFDKVRERYVYACKTDTGTYLVTSKRFTVREDGYYRDFVCNQALSESAGNVLEDDLLTLWEDIEGSTLVPEVSVAVPDTQENGQKDARDLLLQYGDSVKLTATISGRNIAYEDYVELAWKIMTQVRTTLPDIRVNFIQIFYYREGDVLQYESHLQGYSLLFAESAFKNAKNAHYYVELTDEHRDSIKWYSIIRVVNFVVIGGTVIGLGTLWIVRKYKKRKKDKGAA